MSRALCFFLAVAFAFGILFNPTSVQAQEGPELMLVEATDLSTTEICHDGKQVVVNFIAARNHIIVGYHGVAGGARWMNLTSAPTVRFFSGRIGESPIYELNKRLPPGCWEVHPVWKHNLMVAAYVSPLASGSAEAAGRQVRNHRFMNVQTGKLVPTEEIKTPEELRAELAKRERAELEERIFQREMDACTAVCIDTRLLAEATFNGAILLQEGVAQAQQGYPVVITFAGSNGLERWRSTIPLNAGKYRIQWALDRDHERRLAVEIWDSHVPEFYPSNIDFTLMGGRE